jgi:hypothetical protein
MISGIPRFDNRDWLRFDLRRLEAWGNGQTLRGWKNALRRSRNPEKNNPQITQIPQIKKT